MSTRVIVRGRFEDYEAFKEALKKLRETWGIWNYEAYGPTRLDKISDLMTTDQSPVRFWATSGAILGLATFWVMCVMTSLIFSLIVGGKPPVSNVPYIIPAYEGTILFGSIFAFVTALIVALVFRHKLPTSYDPRFSNDSYGVEVVCKPKEAAKIMNILSEAGAVQVDEIAE